VPLLWGTKLPSHQRARGRRRGTTFSRLCNEKSSLDTYDDEEFRKFLLQSMNQKSANTRVRYAKKFAHVLESGDAQSLLQLSAEKRLHVMKALTCLSKFMGCHDTTWIALKRKYNLKWTSGKGSLEIFQRCYGDDSNTLDKMLQWLRQMRQELPPSYSNVFLFCTLTGLRTNECFEAIRLIKDPEHFKTYYQASKQTLEHFRFPELFIRRTKAAYISLVNDEIVDIAKNGITTNISPLNYMKVMYFVVRTKKLKMNMHYCRKIFSSYLRQYGGIESEIIDLLQGRISNTVFAKHYFRPNLQQYTEKVLDALKQLQQQL
jgi:intergrase/recombinase